MKLFYLLIVVILSSCSTYHQPISKTKISRPKNIILLIGDGMGLSQISAGLYTNSNALNLEQFKVIGLHKPYPADKDLITDSAAGATAFSCGCKTYNAAIGVKVDSTPCKTILEYAEEHGLATGLVATCSIEHATPASFIAHSKSRENYEEIATYFLKTEVDLLIGGGKKYFERRTTDTRNLTEELKTKGYEVSGMSEMELKDYSFKNKNSLFFTAEDQPLPAEQGRDYLPVAGKKAVQFLKKRSENGFFLMIEGSQIDWGGHAGKTDYITSEVIDFDNTIGEILEFAKKDKETLVIVTADHETGGFALLTGSTFGNIKGGFADVLDPKTNIYHHSGTLIPVFAFGPGAELFGGIYENTAIFDKMKTLFGF
ncbi:MAG: alkaline phosphatase [Saprospiraceae bacterium]